MEQQSRILVVSVLCVAVATSCGADTTGTNDVAGTDSAAIDTVSDRSVSWDLDGAETLDADTGEFTGDSAIDLGPQETSQDLQEGPFDLLPDLVLCSSDEQCAVDSQAPQACHAWACDPAEGCKEVPLTTLSCDDADQCTIEDRCLSGQCVGQPLNCDDGDQCTDDGCDPETGCWNDPMIDAACDDGDLCTYDDTCTEGACTGTDLECTDDDPCTLDLCAPEVGCSFQPLTGNPCDDGDECTTGDHCQGGECAGNPVSCNDGNPCTQDTCNPTGGCQTSPADGAPCNDGDACTDMDQCVQGMCMGQASACNDGNPCTLDSCDAQGGCIHTEPPGLPCDDDDACTTNDKCYQGSCVGGPALECDDGTECTADSCGAAVGCVFEALSSIPCDDGDACTEEDTCLDGTCAGQEVLCWDETPCTADTCDPAVGCVFVPLDDPCDDGDPCTEGDLCADGQCQPGENPECLAVTRVVLAGDSWSTGLIVPMRDAFDGRGYEEVAISWELTSKPGSKVHGWVTDPNLMTSLYLALDSEPPAEMLLFTLSGNDYLAACKDGLGLLGALEYFVVMTLIQWDLQTFVNLARAGRPELKIVLIGYDYLHFEMIQLLGSTMPGLNTVTFNLGLIDRAGRGRDVAAATPNMLYGHNMGLLQHTFGDTFHPPFLCPNPVFGCPEYGPGAAPKPGPAPGYSPFPGGWYTYPSPVDFIPDGVHPNYDGFRAIIENTLDQGAGAWIEGD
ncbi:MAG: hypothetical protein ABIK09_11950 [Pseudomonadota bacterium]